MNNADMPAMPFEGGQNNQGQPYTGLTKREQFCLAMAVPETGDQELDDIIRKGNKNKLAAMAMQGILSNTNYDAPRRMRIGGMVEDSLHFADALLTELERKK